MTSANTTCESSEYLIKPHELDQRITESGDLIMLPTVATEALELANDPDCSIPKFVSVIETDPSLVTDILSIRPWGDAAVRIAFIPSVRPPIYTDAASLSTAPW